ncbi:hypothetical protein PICMEDRAFT_14988 [Pichia membranifaciens NRRL Y-2026]|uniref:Ribonuclease H2 subunit B wHTH domain-containing protein n=1 Tax=Pichia membranifaciens NRRL Y-2026 TaxID=763406 RepID=A0A1E3NVH7_9ASCO|nr:hypothetical protein PICMEDRAFT_14988 [Pichia membranifaciens NRRL Y-2026]ODQ49553.1 hypothetical protein PICMEDRAFT_14988 [Pichia membranifaciens NRRL Y-2026]
MTISIAELEERKKNDYRVILVPESVSDSSSDTKLITVPNTHPITGKMTDFLITQSEVDNSTSLSVLDRINWKNPNVKNQSYTPDGKPYRCLFITKGDTTASGGSSLIPATILGSEPDIYAMTPFSPLYFLLEYFKPIIQKKHQNREGNDNDQRLLTYEDMMDEICERDEFLGKLVHSFNFDLKKYLEIICDSTSIPSMDSDDEELSVFYKPSIEKIKQFLLTKVEGLTERLILKDQYRSIKLRWETMYPGELPEEIKLSMCRKQSVLLLSNFVDTWYIKESVDYDFSKLDCYIQKVRERENAEDMINESLQQLHEGTAAVLSAQNKKVKTVKKQVKTVKSSSVAVGKGALDMFFKKKI